MGIDNFFNRVIFVLIIGNRNSQISTAFRFSFNYLVYDGALSIGYPHIIVICFNKLFCSYTFFTDIVVISIIKQSTRKIIGTSDGINYLICFFISYPTSFKSTQKVT